MQTPLDYLIAAIYICRKNGRYGCEPDNQVSLVSRLCLRIQGAWTHRETRGLHREMQYGDQVLSDFNQGRGGTADRREHQGALEHREPVALAAGRYLQGG